jgi:hypothetical protein
MSETITAYNHTGVAELLSLDRMWPSSDQGPPGIEIVRRFAEQMQRGVSFPPICVNLWTGGRFNIVNRHYRAAVSRIGQFFGPAETSPEMLGCELHCSDSGQTKTYRKTVRHRSTRQVFRAPTARWIFDRAACAPAFAHAMREE